MSLNTRRLVDIETRFKNTTDTLGLKIDKGILFLVVLLNYYNISTLASCWGHRSWGYAYPWVEFYRDRYEVIKNLIIRFKLDLELVVYEGDDSRFRLQPLNKNLKLGRKEFNRLEAILKTEPISVLELY